MKKHQNQENQKNTQPKEQKKIKTGKYVTICIKDLDDFIFADSEEKRHSEK